MVLCSARLTAWFGGKWTNLLVKESFDYYPAVRLRGPCPSTSRSLSVAEVQGPRSRRAPQVGESVKIYHPSF